MGQEQQRSPDGYVLQAVAPNGTKGKGSKWTRASLPRGNEPGPDASQQEAAAAEVWVAKKVVMLTTQVLHGEDVCQASRARLSA